ncbi:nam9 protein [Coprinopsis cinerea okayama7|uniref:Nam9 protein n=1 Tax=Coprinopsis cinerea (strain Okayama-7 / 130 / ATCC MYA-4618 / FGSC 9003) TaxID=240176 RepID=A8NNB8_COPC7|nr:nam9 protein [Coprinopsis cinerea okayama7\|eukprot:XP_001835093.2 nam9 protein [Coprinopsis cinerea okayama7\
MRDRGVFSFRRALPRMSWSPKNLYNLWRRTMGPRSDDLRFRITASTTLFQQRWKSKALVRAYHGDFIPEKIFKRWYLPETLPDVRPQRSTAPVGDDKAALAEYARRKQREKSFDEEIEEKGMAPVGSLMFQEVERRIDVFLFRCCFAHSVYEARRMVIHGDVLLNGRKHTNANTRLAPGDMVTVNPDAIRFFKKLPGEYDDIVGRLLTPKKPAKDAPATATIEAAETTEAAASTEGTESAAEAAEEQPAAEESKPAEAAEKSTGLTPFYLPHYASPWLFIPAYIEPSFSTCSAIYVRHPTARPGYSEIPTPYDADGALIRYAWEWYVQRRPRVRSKSQLARMPEDRAFKLRQAAEDGILSNAHTNKAQDTERLKRLLKQSKRRGKKVATV